MNTYEKTYTVQIETENGTFETDIKGFNEAKRFVCDVRGAWLAASLGTLDVFFIDYARSFTPDNWDYEIACHGGAEVGQLKVSGKVSTMKVVAN